MKETKEQRKQFETGNYDQWFDWYHHVEKQRYERPTATVSLVLLGYDDGLKFVGYQRNIHPYLGKYVLPGAIISERDSNDQTAINSALNKVGLTSSDVKGLKQFKTYIDTKTDPRGTMINIVYVGYVNELGKVNGELIENGALPLGFNHEEITSDVLDSLKDEFNNYPSVLEVFDELNVNDVKNVIDELGVERSTDNANLRKLLDRVATRTEKKSLGVGQPIQMYRMN